jgi:hypothetical protein
MPQPRDESVDVVEQSKERGRALALPLLLKV